MVEENRNYNIFYEYESYYDHDDGGISTDYITDSESSTRFSQRPLPFTVKQRNDHELGKNILKQEYAPRKERPQEPPPRVLFYLLGLLYRTPGWTRRTQSKAETRIWEAYPLIPGPGPMVILPARSAASAQVPSRGHKEPRMCWISNADATSIFSLFAMCSFTPWCMPMSSPQQSPKNG